MLCPSSPGHGVRPPACEERCVQVQVTSGGGGKGLGRSAYFRPSIHCWFNWHRYYSSTAGGERKEKEVILDGEFLRVDR